MTVCQYQNSCAMSSIFSRIIKGEIPCHKIAETEDFFAFLDINPLAKGHTLVVTKQEIDYFFDIDDRLLGDMMVFAKRVAKAVEAAIPCERIGVSVIGLEVPHAHVHLIPINTLSDMSFTKQRVKLSSEEFAAIAEAIRGQY